MQLSLFQRHQHGYQNTKSLSDLWRILPFATLLDSGGGNHPGAVNEPTMDNSLKKKPNKKGKRE